MGLKTEKSPEFYEYYPKLFSSFFKNVAPDVVDELSAAGYLYYQSILSTDSVIDDKEISKILHALNYQEEAIKKLTHLFGKDSIFWNVWNTRKKEYQKAILIEKQLSEQKKVSFLQYESLADYKATFGKVAIDSIYTLSGSKDKDLYNTLLVSHYYFSVGFQLYDDVKDFYEDSLKRQFNWAVYQTHKNLNEREKQLPPDILNKLLFIRGIGQKILSLSVQQFKKAKKALGKYAANSLWEKTILEMEETISNYLDETHGYLLILEKNIELEDNPDNKNSFFNYSKIKNRTIKLGLSFIEKDYLKNYAELQHIMYLSKKQGFSNQSPIQVSDVFQRALLNDCLFFVAEKYKLNINDYLNTEVDYLIEKRRKDSAGGWSYYPEVKEIAADIDDLGQMLQLFINTNRNEAVEKYCKKPINIALENRVCSSGGIETWIIPKEKQTQTQKKQELFNQTKWGTGPDIEVVANFIYALHLLKEEKYAPIIKNALNYIAKEQHEEGFWLARWYYGFYYGTYTAIRVLSANTEKYKKNIDIATKFILKSQNKDGGWGEINCSDVMNTSLALLSLQLINCKEFEKIINSGKKYLINTQNKIGYWNEADFIKPKTSQPYRSKVLTTAFVLKALSV